VCVCTSVHISKIKVYVKCSKLLRKLKGWWKRKSFMIFFKELNSLLQYKTFLTLSQWESKSRSWTPETKGVDSRGLEGRIAAHSVTPSIRTKHASCVTSTALTQILGSIWKKTCWFSVAAYVDIEHNPFGYSMI
jgi:hypothetical protein